MRAGRLLDRLFLNAGRRWGYVVAPDGWQVHLAKPSFAASRSVCLYDGNGPALLSRRASYQAIQPHSRVGYGAGLVFGIRDSWHSWNDSPPGLYSDGLLRIDGVAGVAALA